MIVDFEFEWEGRRYAESDFEQTWEIEFPENEIAQIKALRDIDGSLCGDGVIAKTIEEEFFICWRERHPEMLPYDEYCDLFVGGRDTKTGWAKYAALKEAMPAKDYVKRITRQEAALTLATLWIPPEFHRDLGLGMEEKK